MNFNVAQILAAKNLGCINCLKKKKKKKKKEDLRDYIIMCSSGFYTPTVTEKDSVSDSFKLLCTNLPEEKKKKKKQKKLG